MDHLRLGIVGYRNFHNYDLLEREVVEFIGGHPNIQLLTGIVSGGCQGADTLAEMFADKHHIPMTIHSAEWTTYGKNAGPMRNSLIVRDSDMIIAFVSKSSVGTFDTIRKANAANKPVKIVNV